MNGLLLWQVQGNEEARSLSLARKELFSLLDRSTTNTNENAGQQEVPVQLQYVNLFDASHNNLSKLSGLVDIAPSAWWINLRGNKIADDSGLRPLPMAVGSLDLSGNPVSAEIERALATVHCLRLNLRPEDTLQQQQTSLGLMPNVWVLNDNFYTMTERIAMSALVAESDLQKSIEKSACLPAKSTGSHASGGSIAHSHKSLELGLESIDGTSNINVPEVEMKGEISDDVSAGGLSMTDDFPVVAASALLDTNPLLSWGLRLPGNREGAFLSAVHTFTPTAAYPLDHYRLDVLLEDYLEEAFLANANNIPYQGVDKKRYPVVDVFALICLPRQIMMDLLVFLTSSLIFPLPKALTEDVIIHMLVDYISPKAAIDLINMPSFAKTAINSMIRRVLYKEEEELRQYSTLLNKSVLAKPLHEMEEIQEYSGTSKGWKHLYACLEYLHTSVIVLEKILHKHNGGKMPNKPRVKPGPLTTVASASTSALHASTSSMDSVPNVNTDSVGLLHNSLTSYDSSATPLPHRFSSLEFQLLTVIPDIITATTPSSGSAHAVNTQWISLAARHTIVMFAKSDQCPNLMKPQISSKLQDTYFELLPILTAAKMTMRDLVDEDMYAYGRIDNDKAVSAEEWKQVEMQLASQQTTTMQMGLPDDDEDAAAVELQIQQNGHQRSRGKPKRLAILSGNALSFGTGLPRGDSDKLTWNQPDKVPSERTYDLWNDHRYRGEKGEERNAYRKLQQDQFMHLKKYADHARSGKSFGNNGTLTSMLADPIISFDHSGSNSIPKQMPVNQKKVLVTEELSLNSVIGSDDGEEQEKTDVHSPVQIGTSFIVQMPEGSTEIARALSIDGFPDENSQEFTDNIASNNNSPSPLMKGGGTSHISKSNPLLQHGLSEQGSTALTLDSRNSAERASVTSNRLDDSMVISAKVPPAGALTPEHALQQKKMMMSVRPTSPMGNVALSNARGSVPTATSPARTAVMISGFSANASRESKFLLASTSVAIENNRNASSPVNKLSMLHQAPVLIHPTSAGILPVPNYMNGDSMMIDLQDSIPYLEPNNGNGNGNGNRNGGDDDLSVSLASTSSESTYNPASSARNLLAEMGTLRNIRNLLIDDGAYKVPPIRLVSTNTAGTLGGNINGSRSDNPSTTFLTAPGASNRQNNEFYGSESQQSYNNNQYAVIGKNNREVETQFTNRNEEKPKEKIFKARQLDTILTSADLMKMKTNYANIFTAAEMPTKKGYTNNSTHHKGRDNVGSGAGQQLGMRQADTTFEGKPMSASWYPVPNKPTFTLAPERQDSIDQAMRALYGTEISLEQSPKVKITNKKKGQVTYTTAKLRVAQENKSKNTWASSSSSNFSVSQNSGKNPRYNPNSSQSVFQESVQVGIQPPPQEASMNNVNTSLQPSVKANIMHSSSNYNNDESSLDGTRENYYASNKLGLSKSFKVHQNTFESMVGFGNGLGSTFS